MTVIVTDTGFGPENFEGPYATPETRTPESRALDLTSDTDVSTLEGGLDGIVLIRVDFPSFADGRGFSIARALRRLGYARRLRAKGHVLADQYAMARRSGFDEVEIDAALAARQPEPDWRARADWREHDYRSRLAS
ncbi:DUF934 domain-containing protein [Tropicimonas sp. TH_r6]|uniref:DUF934 domain-containing protein n=1 Tax=Tropicimonas sp. TH_r6 TaxID=3082085 RepID=UPI0029535EBD|nr:DUF934 domain-containing protein [Tropicimonas sp. TH_r6]MDV7142656.1 DUF934 domain-containing protein [Tropicimonas sp. TH_r6]